jgi:hypothetical protein
MKRVMIFLILFLIAGSVTALGYSLYQVGIVGDKNATSHQTVSDQNSNADPQDENKDLSWMKEIIGISEDENINTTTSTIEDTPATSTFIGGDMVTSTALLTDLSTSSTSDSPDDLATSTRKEPNDINLEERTEPSVQDLGKMDALESTIYDYASKSLALSADIRKGTVSLTWTQTSSESFVDYQIVRSTTDQNPYLPKTSSVKTISNASQTSYTDARVQSDTVYYYRICMTRANAVPACGNVLQIHL